MIELDAAFFHVNLKHGFINFYHRCYSNKYEALYNDFSSIRYGKPVSWTDAKAWMAYQEFQGKSRMFRIFSGKNDMYPKFYFKLGEFLTTVERIEGDSNKWEAS